MNVPPPLPPHGFWRTSESLRALFRELESALRSDPAALARLREIQALQFRLEGAVVRDETRARPACA